MKYHAHLTANQGTNRVPINPCQLLDFNFLKLGAGEEYTTNTSSREILAVILEGKATFIINGTTFKKVGREGRRTLLGFRWKTPTRCISPLEGGGCF
jgi:5-deoxy-glucuronate isomerase